MSRNFDFIKDLNKERAIWKIAVRVIDSWVVTGTNGFQHLEMVIADEKGDRVHAITRYKEFEHWKSFIQDRKVYVLYNCQVYDTEIGLKPCEGPFKVVFGSGTNIKPAPEITNIPDQDFWFKNFKEANDGNFKINVLYEIIGVLHEVVKTQTLASGKKPCTNLILTDESGTLVDVTLWEAFSTQLSNYINARKDRGPIVIILTHAQCKKGDNGRASFSNNWSGSKLLINYEHPSVESFKSSFQDIASTQGATQDFTQVSSSSQFSGNDIFSNRSQFTSIKLSSGEDDPRIYPVFLDKLLNLELAFKVKFQPYYRQASINKLSTDDSIINDIKLHINPPQASQSQSQSVSNLAASTKPTSTPDYINPQYSDSIQSQASPMFSKSVSSLPDTSIKTEKDSTQCSDSLNYPLVSLSATSDDFDHTSNITPAKRVSMENEITPDIPSPTLNEAQLSSTKLRISTRKGGKNTKLE
ncbi:hypothetical protein P8452_63931 [Trifolium repens]|nr:hypothetical protein P8452_63931 [Trifolium repens]